MILSLYSRVAVKVGDERYVFDRGELMFTEVCEIEKATGLSFWEWQQELNRYSILALGGLLHMLRRRAGVPSDFASMQFNVTDFDVVPLHDDGSEFTAEEIAADITARMKAPEADPTPAGGENQPPATTASTSPTSPNVSGSAPGSGNGSHGATSPSSKRAPTPS